MLAEGKQLSPQHINQHLLVFNLSSVGGETSAEAPLSPETGNARGTAVDASPVGVATGGSSVNARAAKSGANQACKGLLLSSPQVAV